MTHRRLLFFLMTYFVIVGYSQAQSYIFFAKPKSLHWKFFNIKGEIVINKILDDTHQFSEDGFAIAGKDTYVIINRHGEKLKTETSTEQLQLGKGAKGYSDGLIVVRDHSKYGCLDTLGKIKIPFKYYDITQFNGGHAIARIKNKYFVIDIEGNETRVDDSTVVDMWPFRENLAPFRGKNDKSGFIDTNGKIVIPAQFDGVGYFFGGLAWARNDNDLVGFINTEGKWVIQPQFDIVEDFDIESRMARCKVKRVENGTTVWRWMYVNTTGKITAFNSSDARDDFSEGLLVNKKDDQYGFIDNEGNWIILPQYDRAENFKYGLAWVRQQGLWGIIDKQGTWVLTPRFLDVRNIVKLK